MGTSSRIAGQVPWGCPIGHLPAIRTRSAGFGLRGSPRTRYLAPPGYLRASVPALLSDGPEEAFSDVGLAELAVGPDAGRRRCSGGSAIDRAYKRTPRRTLHAEAPPRA